MIKLPLENIWKQLNLGDRFGDILASFGLDLSSDFAKLRISPRMLVNVDTTDIAELDVAPFAIVYNPEADDHKFQVGASDRLFVGGDYPNSSFADDDATSEPSFETTARPDLAFFNGFTYGMSAELYKRADSGASWGSAITALGGSFGGAPLIPFGATGRLYYRGDAVDKMFSIDTAETAIESGQYTIDLNDSNHAIVCGKASSDFIWLGTLAPQGQKARVHAWNGSSTSVSETYEIDAQGVLAIGIKDNTPVLLDSNGVLRQLNGGAFIEIARLPFKKGKALRPLTGVQTTWLCHYNGLVVDGDVILMNLNTTYADGTTDEKIPSGIWEYNEKNGLFHRYSYGLVKSDGTITDYGAQKVSAVGALAVAKIPNSSANGTILAGATIYTTASATKSGIFYNDANDTLQKAGCVTTTKLFSSNITDIWQKIYHILGRRFLNATDKVVIKARNKEDEPDEITITYVNTTSFTATASAFARTPVVGDEVEIIQGIGAGRCAHITAVTGTTTLTITVDETITGATTQTAKARFQTWKKIGAYSAQTDDFIKLPFPNELLGISTWIQVKVWILWTGRNEIANIIISNKVNEAIE